MWYTLLRTQVFPITSREFNEFLSCQGPNEVGKELLSLPLPSSFTWFFSIPCIIKSEKDVENLWHFVSGCDLRHVGDLWKSFCSSTVACSPTFVRFSNHRRRSMSRTSHISDRRSATNCRGCRQMGVASVLLNDRMIWLFDGTQIISKDNELILSPLCQTPQHTHMLQRQMSHCCRTLT
jgi:hypothetical protein